LGKKCSNRVIALCPAGYWIHQRDLHVIPFGMSLTLDTTGACGQFRVRDL
jgi:hypothetical protein